MDVKFFQIPTDFQSYFPIIIDNMRVELLEGVDGGKYIAEKCLVWSEFLAKFDNDLARKEELTPLYNYVLNSDTVSAELKKQIVEGV